LSQETHIENLSNDASVAASAENQESVENDALKDDATIEQRQHYATKLKQDRDAAISEAEAAKAEAAKWQRQHDSVAARIRRDTAAREAEFRTQYGDIDLDQPDPDLLASDDEYRNKVVQGIEQRAEQRAIDRMRNEQAVTNWENAERTFAASTPDYSDQVRNIEPKLAGALHVELMSHPEGPKIAYYIAKTPDVQARISDAFYAGDVKQAYIELGRAEVMAGIQTHTQASPSPASKLPPVIKPVGASGSGAGVIQPKEGMSDDEYQAYRTQKGWA
jgi:hypothetical protein